MPDDESAHGVGDPDFDGSEATRTSSGEPEPDNPNAEGGAFGAFTVTNDISEGAR